MSEAWATGVVIGTLAGATFRPDHPLYGAVITPVVDGNGDYTRRIEISTSDGQIFVLALFEDFTIIEADHAA
jgi:hypothetical protein